MFWKPEVWALYSKFAFEFLAFSWNIDVKLNEQSFDFVRQTVSPEKTYFGKLLKK
jgi:hypothetical protein